MKKTLRLGILGISFLLMAGSLSAQVEVDRVSRFKGQFGSKVFLTGPVPSANFLPDSSPDNEARYIARFYIHTTNLTLQNNDEVTLLRAFDAGNNSVFRLAVENANGTRRLLVEAREDGGGLVPLPAVNRPTLENGWHAVEVDWTAAVATGSLRLFLDGAEVNGLTSLNNGLGTVSRIRFGVETPPTQAAGQILLDDFDSRRDTRIGILCITDAEYNGFFPDFPDINVRRILEHDPHRCQAGTVLPQ